MENIEKVEKLRERANVTYEEAKLALEENNWDLLDAMVSLEKQGKTKKPEQASYSTSYDQQENIVSVKEKTEEKKHSRMNGRTLRELLHNFFRICLDNSFVVDRNDHEIFRIPVIALVLALCFWQATLPVALVALIFGCRYRFEGKDELDKVNEFMASAGSAAENLKEGFQAGFEKKSDDEKHE